MATVIPGHQFKFGLSKQSAEGTPATAVDYQIPVYSAGFKELQGRTPYEVADGGAYRSGQFIDSASMNGPIEWAAFPDSIGRLLTAHMGSDTITGAGDPYTHTIVSNNIPQWCTGWIGRPLTGATTEWTKATDLTVKSVDIVHQVKQMLHVSTELMAKTGMVKATAPTITVANSLTSAAEKFTFVNPTLKLDLNATPATTTITNLQSFTIHMGYESADHLWTTQITPSFRDLKLWTLSFSASFIMQDWNALYTTFYGALAPSANTPLSNLVVSGALDFTIAVDPVNANHTLQVTCPNMDFSIDAPDVNIDGSGIIVTLTGVTERPASAQPVTAVLKNAVSTAF